MKNFDGENRKRKFSEPFNLLTRLYELKTKGSFCDVQLNLQGTTMLAHACVLAACSSYFHELFDHQETHWCTKCPLVLDLQSLWDSPKDLCLICVSKIIDFMYLKELVIMQDHYEHFTEINTLFGIFDLTLPEKTLKKLKSDNQFAKSKEEDFSDSSEIVSGKNRSPNLIGKQFTVSKSNVTNGFSSSNKELCSDNTQKDNDSNIDKLILNLNGCCKDDNLETTISYSTKPKGPIDSSVSSLELSTEAKRTTDLKTSCEFMCCNPEPDISSPLKKPQKRRKISCELCNFSSVSISKVLKHLQSEDHLKDKCPICLIGIPNVCELKEHLKCHSDSKPFICHICCKRNRYWEYHKMHLKIHCRNKKFYCDLCQRGFLSKRSLTEHLTTHKESYLCRSCDYYTTDLNLYQSHMQEHSKVVKGEDLDQILHLDTDLEPIKQKAKNFQCQICDKRFTQKKNLARHVKLKHFEATKFECSMCPFFSNRIDLLSTHLKKKHNCTLIKEKKKRIAKKQPKQVNEPPSEFVSILVPIKLVSDNSVAEEPLLGNGEQGFDNEATPQVIYDNHSTFSNSHVVLNQNQTLLVDKLSCSVEPKKLNNLFSHPSDYEQNRSIPENLGKQSVEIDHCEISNSDDLSNNLQTSYTSSSQSLSLSSQIFRDVTNKSNDTDTRASETILESNHYIWLNEATGELLNDETLTNIQVQNNFSKSKQSIPVTENLTLDLGDQLKSGMVNEAAGEYSLDFRDDNDEWQFPQTPQPNVVGLDDCDGIFPWNQIDNSFYSTWVLNEATGELNMVSFFSIQSVRNPTELKMDESSEAPTAMEDDDTALFLNEGTGDLSTIYFNPSGPDSNNRPIEKTSQDNIETLSDVSDDDSDFLNEEFMKASADFMSNEENNKFLNELTGEFDIAGLNTYQPEVLGCPFPNESYLNEETGEIWNVVDGNVNNDLLMKSNGLDYDLDDSLNCEEFEPIFNDVNSFSSQFCLDEGSNNWQTSDETNDTLVLNECTGELVKKT
ncbi:uncharacterized protein LOC129001301 [Macrosteles quadrilineatus]|uniref:uncharacterized protein LOC129001301 n=1 Tax=Macrosteles quadrilineatus TaxID=74068 RepID=UPI0023E2A44F|nr:uncharacterized protein LOC129001301 [Macrosteles quadrilineatus]XP_054284529.1 uncharacterized protein LOC129001301 [Macrosteles quadrilineatus]